jgi:alpha-ketoglutarate-dependent taurine dioxygenase
MTVRTEPRGAPDNVGNALRAIHPVIRTNPVTGWKSLFVNKEYYYSRCSFI